MKKIFKIGLLFTVLLVTVFTIYACGANQKKVEDFPELVNKLDSYKVTGKLYSMFPTGTKESLVTVYYQKPDNYRVEIDNSSNGDKQIILKNTDGVYVLIPAVNKSFKIKSAWPINSSYPYLLQSLSKDYINDTDKLITKDDETTTIEMDIKMFENANPSTQKVIFKNATGYPNEVQVFDEKKNLVSRFVFLNIEENPTFEAELFQKEPTMTSCYETYSQIEYNRQSTYPTYYPDATKLKEEKTIKNANEKTVIMKYTGDVTYTIVEKYVYSKELEKTNFLDGDLYVMGEYVTIVNNNNITFLTQGMEYYIASNDLEVLEMIKMGNSLINDYEK